MICRILLLLATVCCAWPAAIKSDETVVFFPTTGRLTSDRSSWELEIHGIVYESAQAGLTLALLRASLGIAEVEMDNEAKTIFAERTRVFLADNERGKAVSIRIGSHLYPMNETEANGHFHGRLLLSAGEVERWSSANSAGPTRIAYRAELEPGDNRAFTGEVFLVAPTGLSVISDVDDTIKLSQVTDRKALLRNTFLEPFQPVAGMASQYQSWATNAGTQFHYVSASPWQLFGPLSEFVRTHGFPAGSMHLRMFRWKDESFANLFASPEAYKRSVIETLLERFPARRFILVGDSGEKDPEIYAALARRYPNQIERILIRDVTGRSANHPRYQTCFGDLPPSLWRIFDGPKDSLE